MLQMPLSETAETIQAVWVEDDVSGCNPLSYGCHLNLLFFQNILIVASDSDRAVTTVWLG